MVESLPREFSRVQGKGEVETIFFSDAKLVPERVPDNSLFISKEKAKIQDFAQLLEFFGESFVGSNQNFVIFCLGSNDLSHADKKWVFSEKEQHFGFHVTPNYPYRYVDQNFACLLETIVEVGNVNKLISFDAMSRASAGYHNTGVEYINRRMKKVCDGHMHFNTWKRYQRDLRKKKEKTTKNFPLWSERFDDDGELKEEEKNKLAAAAIAALTSDGNVEVDDALFLRKF